jgi:hypothetical protein
MAPFGEPAYLRQESKPFSGSRTGARPLQRSGGQDTRKFFECVPGSKKQQVSNLAHIYAQGRFSTRPKFMLRGDLLRFRNQEDASETL